MKTKLYLIIVMFAFVGLSANAQRGAQVGYVDMDYVLTNVSSYQEATEQLDKKVQQWNEEIVIKQNEIKAMERALDNERPLLTEALIQERQGEIDLKQKKLLRYKQERFGPNGDLIKLKRRLVKPVQDQVFTAVQEIGKTRQYDFIFENSSDALMLYSANRHDLSEEVLQMIERTERKQDRKEDLEKTDVPYKSVRQASEDREKRAERQAKLNARKRHQDSLINAREQQRAALQAAREAKIKARQEQIERRRADMKRKRDSLQNARQQRIEALKEDDNN